jgi:UDPglucose--hexose-1-phosphate uridylyltransferase
MDSPMAELRQNLATKEWVLIASERARRPQEFAESTRRLTHTLPQHDAACPFCPGNEHMVRPDVWHYPDKGPWQVRIFPNMFPALNRDGARVQCLEGIHRKLSGVGFHEVLVETALHNQTPAQQPVDQIHRTLRAFQERGRELMADSRLEQIIYFKNHGPQAGSSLAHSHGQLVALPMVPHTVRRRIEEVRRTFDDEGRCPYCQMLTIELDEGDRLVALNGSFVAFVPYAAMSPFHLWIVPRRHGPTFLDQTSLELLHLAQIMRETLGKLYYGLNDPDYNYVIHSAPVRDSSSAYLHWYVSIIPRVTKSAGFELGTGMYINPALPEESAAFLRAQVLPDEQALPKPETDATEEALARALNEVVGEAAPAAPNASAQIVHADEWQVE